MLLVLLIIFAVILVFAIVAMFVIYRLSNSRKYKSEVHFLGGASTDTGQISRDNNYFKGISSQLDETTVVGTSDFAKNKKTKNIKIRISNLNNSSVDDLLITDYLIFGRISGEKRYSITNDGAVSKEHCKLYVYNDSLCLCDLNSSNHTYINGKIINEAVFYKSGDLIKMGNTFIKVEVYS